MSAVLTQRAACAIRAPLVAACAALSVACEGGSQTLAIPEAHDWLDCGVVLEAGQEGDWDYELSGGFALAAVIKEGTYFLYYQGARGYNDSAGTVTWRAIGVATSADGVRFTKHPDNPVLIWYPRQNFEEGAVSTGAFVDAAGEVVMYYGANTWTHRDRVNADTRLAVSRDGVRFEERGVVLNHSNPRVWGAGDELFPIAAFEESGRRVVYYIPNGTPEGGRLGVAWGNPTLLAQTAEARAAGEGIQAWGPGAAVRIGPGQYAVFVSKLRDATEPAMEVHAVSAWSPRRLSRPLARYTFPDLYGTVVLDEPRAQWLMYYRTDRGDGLGVRIAPARSARVGEAPRQADRC